MPEIEKQLNYIIGLLLMVLRKVGIVMANIDDLVAGVAQETTVESSLITLVGNIESQLKTALAGTTIPADVQAKIDAAFATVQSNIATVSAAVTANTPAAPVVGEGTQS